MSSWQEDAPLEESRPGLLLFVLLLARDLQLGVSYRVERGPPTARQTPGYSPVFIPLW